MTKWPKMAYTKCEAPDHFAKPRVGLGSSLLVLYLLQGPSRYCVSKQPAKILTRLRGCADWSGSPLFAFVLRCLFSAPGPNMLLGPVVQSIVSITSSLVVKILTALISRISDSQVLFAAKMWVAFAKATHILSAKILAYMPYLTIKVLTIR